MAMTDMISLRPAWRAPLAATIALVASACASPPQPQAAAANAARGVTVVTQWCSECHAIMGVESNANRAPTFEQVAARPGRDRAYLTTFLNEDHFPMSTYRLLDDEKADVVAMIVGLKP
jgi:mono/diheme cytochrome c family protein